MQKRRERKITGKLQETITDHFTFIPLMQRTEPSEPATCNGLLAPPHEPMTGRLKDSFSPVLRYQAQAMALPTLRASLSVTFTPILVSPAVSFLDLPPAPKYHVNDAVHSDKLLYKYKPSIAHTHTHTHGGDRPFPD